MSRKYDFSAAKPVLRDVVIHSQAHTLATSKPLPPKQTTPSGASNNAPTTGNAAEVAQTAYDAAFSAAYADGLAAGTAAGNEKGYKDGFQGGYAHGIKEGRELGKTEGQNEGYTQGLSNGHKAASDSVKAEIERRCAQIDLLLSDLPIQISQRLASVEDDMVALSFAAVCRVIGDSLVSQDGLRQTLGHLVEQMRTNQLIAVHLHPDDFSALENDELIAQMLRQHQAGSQLRWVADNTVTLGGAILRSSEGSLDARLETQLKTLHETLLEVRRQRTAAAAKQNVLQPLNHEPREQI